MSDISKSMKEILNERISSPFYGSLIVSWILWNWEIPYVTFFVDPTKLDLNKLDYIKINCSNVWFLVVGPLVSTFVIIWLLPYISNKAYEITLRYDTKRINKKHEIEKSQLLTYEESLKLRTEMLSLEQHYAEMLNNKENEITNLKNQLSQILEKQIPESTKLPIKSSFQDSFDYNEFQEFVRDKRSGFITSIIEKFKKTGFNTLEEIPEEIRNFFIAYDLIDFDKGYYSLSPKGQKYYKDYLKTMVRRKIKTSNKN